MNKITKKVILSLIIIALGVVIGSAPKSYVKVDPGQRAIKTEWGVIKDTTYAPGLVWKIPFTENLGNEIFVVDIKPQRYQYPLQARTKDMQRVKWDVAILCELNPDKVHVMYDKYLGYSEYEEKVIRDLVKTTMLSLTSMAEFWAIAGNETNIITSAIEYIVNDQLMSDNLVSLSSLRILDYKASEEIEKMIEEIALAKQGITLETYKAQMAKAATERVKQEAIQAYERLAAEAKAKGLEVELVSKAVNNPFIAQYEVAKALQKWNGEVALPQTLTLMESANGGASVFPIMPINTGKK